MSSQERYPFETASIRSKLLRILLTLIIMMTGASQAAAQGPEDGGPTEKVGVAALTGALAGSTATHEVKKAKERVGTAAISGSIIGATEASQPGATTTGALLGTGASANK